MIGYKCTDMNGCCRGFKFEVGKTYTKDTPKEKLECCTDKVFHFCRELYAIEKVSDYKLTESRLFEVISGDFVRDGDRYGTNTLTILREIEGAEKLDLINSGDCNSGKCNSGDCNSGSWNSGNKNSGNKNSGDCNSGDCNSGKCNSGDWNSGNKNSGSWNSGTKNSGDWNSGDCNSGKCNSGDWNSGDCNSGDWNSGNKNSGTKNSGDYNSGNKNSGDCNSGSWNSGDWNSGDWNSGNKNSGDCNSGNKNSGSWNSGDCNSGFFNSDKPYVRMFNKMTDKKEEDIDIPSWCYFDLTEWVSHDTATKEEKQKHKAEIEVCGGFLRSINYKDAWRHAWNRASIEERKKLFDLPNWDNQVFKEITGIDAETEIAKEIKEK